MASTMSKGSSLYAFIASRRTEGERLYALADAARDRTLTFAARDRFRLSIRSLFGEGTVREVQDVAPYLVDLEFGAKYPYPASGYLDLWSDRLGDSAGILLLTSVDPEALWTHLAGLFRVTDESGKKFYFRYYDPRVLRLFLPSCSPAEAREFFGPTRLIFVESEDPGRLAVCRGGHRGVNLSEFDLSDSAARVAEGGNR